MAGKSPVKARSAARRRLKLWRFRVIAARRTGARNMLTLDGWTSAQIAEVFRVREDTVRFWRGDFARGGVGAIKASV